MTEHLARVCDGALVAMFCVALAVPLVLTSSTAWDAAAERRAESPLPKADLLLADPKDFTTAAEDYFDDHFGMRRALVDLRNLIDVRVFRASPTPLVTMGRQDWLFFEGDGSREDFAGRRALAPADLAAWRAAVTRRRDQLAAQGITYVLAVIPNKQTVYPEFLPGGVRAGVSRAQQFSDDLRGTDVADTVLFLAPSLIAAKGRGDLYQHLDSHWNARGAYVAYRAIMERVEQLSGHAHNLVTFPWDAFTPAPEQDRDLARMMGVPLQASGAVDPSRLPIPRITIAEFEGIDATPAEDLAKQDAARSCSSADGRILLFHDSFGGAIWRYFAGSFARLRTHSRQPNDDQLQRYVALERPDVVVELGVERNLDPAR